MTIAVAPSEWGPNLDAFAVRNLRVTQPPAHGDGPADLAALERLLATAIPAATDRTTGNCFSRPGYRGP
jgi:hypothetical protein